MAKLASAPLFKDSLSAAHQVFKGLCNVVGRDPVLATYRASRAKANLAYLSNVEVLTGDGSQYDLEPCDVILIHAGVTHPRSLWLDRLRPDGRLLLPLTFDFSGTNFGKGAVLVIRRAGLSFAAFFLPQPVLISSCTGVRDDELNERLLNGFRAGMVQSVHSLRRGVHEPDSTCCLHSDRFHFCLSKRRLFKLPGRTS